MRRTIVFTCVALCSFAVAFAQDGGTRSLSIATLHDKIEGGWAGQMIGVSFGAPTEFRFNEKIIPPDKLPAWKPDMVTNAIQQDDLYVDMTFAKVLDEKGVGATTDDFGAMFRNARYHLWHANLAARRALKRGVPATLSGTPRYNSHANDIDFQIESDFVGLMAPGLPRAANEICLRAGRVMNSGDGILGGMFISGMYAAAFFESDPRKVVEAGLANIPPESPYARVIRDVLSWSAQYPDDWMKVWHLIGEKWDKREPCPSGALRPFNIDAKLNGAYVALGLLYGHGDFGKTLEVAARSGQDSDCNPSSAGGILGVMLGYRRIPEKWKSGIAAIADEKFNYTDFTFHSIVASTQRRAIALVKANGGTADGENLAIKTQKAAPVEVALWDNYGSPVERIPVSDPRWSWKGPWKNDAQEHRNTARVTKATSERGAEASVTFEGTGAMITGTYLPDGGKATVYLDGKRDRTVDVYPDEDQPKFGEDVWHAFGLRNGRHTLRLVVDGEPGPGSGGRTVALEDVVVFR